MTWQGKRRKQLPRNWAALRKQRLELDGYRCTALVTDLPIVTSLSSTGQPFQHWDRRCPARATEVDHHEGPHDHRLSSLRSLCHAHHMEKTQREAHAAKAKARITNPFVNPRFRPTAKHPGLR